MSFHINTPNILHKNRKFPEIPKGSYGKLGIQQRVVPNYRVAFFDRLAELYPNSVEVFASEPRADESIQSDSTLKAALFCIARNLRRFNKSAVVGGESEAQENLSDGAGQIGIGQKKE